MNLLFPLSVASYNQPDGDLVRDPYLYTARVGNHKFHKYYGYDDY